MLLLLLLLLRVVFICPAVAINNIVTRARCALGWSTEDKKNTRFYLADASRLRRLPFAVYAPVTLLLFHRLESACAESENRGRPKCSRRAVMRRPREHLLSHTRARVHAARNRQPEKPRNLNECCLAGEIVKQKQTIYVGRDTAVFNTQWHAQSLREVARRKTVLRCV